MTSRTALLLCLAISFISPSLASEEQPSQFLNVRLTDGSVPRYATFPASTVKLLFPEGNAVLDPETAPFTWKSALTTAWTKLQFVKVSDPRRRFAISGVVYGRQLFIFDELFCGENPGVMSQLIHAAGISPKNADEAAGLTKLYLSLTYYRLRDPAQFIVANVEDIPPEKVTFPEENLESLRDVIHAPSAIPAGPGFEVELFARDLDMSRIHRWRMTLSPIGLQNVTDQRVYPSFQEMEALYSSAAKKTAEDGEEKIELRRCCFMANGQTDDGAETDLQVLAASNGPFVGRTHYYYKSSEQVEKFMQRRFAEAVSVIKDRPWLDSEGKLAGRRAILILATPDKTLSAVQLFEHDDNVLEFSSDCLRNLLALNMEAPKGKGATGSLTAQLDCPDRVNSIAFSPDGKQLAAGYGWNVEGGVRVWTVADQKEVHSWTAAKLADSGHTEKSGMIRKVAFSPDGKLLAAATWDGDILFFNMSAWGEPRKLDFQAGSPSALSFSPQGDLLALSTDKKVILYELRTGNVKTIKTQQNIAQRFIEGGFLPDGRTLVGCDSRTLEFWDINADKSTRSFPLSGLNFFCRVSPRGYYVIAGGGAVYGKKLVEVWQVNGERPPSQISGFHNGLFAAAVSHSEEMMAFGGGNYGSGGEVVLWKVGDTQESGHVTTGKFPIEDLAFSADDTILAAASHDGAVFLYAVDRIRTAQNENVSPAH